MGDVAAAVQVLHNGPDPVREARNAEALRILRARGAEDIAQILGLLPPPPRPRRGNRVDCRSAPQDAVARPCGMCGAEFLPTTRQQKTCSRSCGSKLAGRTRTERITALAQEEATS